MVSDYSVDVDSFVPGKPKLWGDTQFIFRNGARNLDLAPDGKRFVVLSAVKADAGEKGPVHVTVLENFFDELRRRVPVK